MHCSNFHAERTSPDCPFCIVRMLVRVIERLDPHAPELTPAVMLLDRAKQAQASARQAAR